MSKTIKYTFPQIFFEVREVEVPDEFELDQLAWEDRVDFMYQHLSELDKQWIGSPSSDKDQKKTIEQSMDAGYTYIREVEPCQTQ